MWTKQAPRKRRQKPEDNEKDEERTADEGGKGKAESASSSTSTDSDSDSDSRCDKEEDTEMPDTEMPELAQEIEKIEAMESPKNAKKADPPLKKLRRSIKYRNLADVEQNKRTASKSASPATDVVTPPKAKAKAKVERPTPVKAKAKAKVKAKARTRKESHIKTELEAAPTAAQPRAGPPRPPEFFDLFAAPQHTQAFLQVVLLRNLA